MNLTTINKGVKAAYHAMGIKGAGITIALIDSGCNIRDNRITRVPGFDAADAEGHGSMIAALLLEWLPECRILSYNIKGGTAFGSNTNALRDILQRAKQGGRYLVNISQDFGYDADHEQLINKLVARNVPVFAAAGNDGGEGIGIYPSHYQSPICVAALDNDGSRAAFSTFHGEMDFAEVGTGVSVTVNGKAGVFNGTSVACPILLAKAALMICERSTITEPQLYADLKACAVDLGTGGYDPYTGWGHTAPKPIAKEEKPVVSKHITVRYGDSGAEVVLLKGYLMRLGYLKISTKPTFGSDTLRAVKAFQKARGLDVDGVCGPITWKAIDAAIAALDKPKTLVARFITWLRIMLGDIYGWGAQGEDLTAMKDPEGWLKKIETSTTNANRAIALYRKRKAEGRCPIRAFDCSGLIVRWLLDNGILKSDASSRGLYAMCEPIKDRSALIPGDFVFRHNGLKIHHVGVYIGDGQVIECMGRDDGVVERPIDKSGKAYWNRYGRLKALQK